MDVVQPHGDIGGRTVRRQLRRDRRRADDHDIGFELLRLEGDRIFVVPVLVARKLRTQPDDAVLSAAEPGILAGRDGEFGLGRSGSVDAPAAGRTRIEVKRLDFDPASRPSVPGDPPARACVVRCRRRNGIHHIVPAQGISLDAGVFTLQPSVRPSQRLPEEAGFRPGHGEMRIFVRPGTDDSPGRPVRSVR